MRRDDLRHSGSKKREKGTAALAHDHTTYDLRRLRLKHLIQRVPKSHRYVFTSTGRHAALALFQRMGIDGVFLSDGGFSELEDPPQSDFYAFFITGNGNARQRPMPPHAQHCKHWHDELLGGHSLRGVPCPSLPVRSPAAWIRSFYTTRAHRALTATFWQLLHFSTSLPRYAPPSSPGTAGAGGGVGAPGTGATVTPRDDQLLFYHSGGAIPAHVAVSLGGDPAISLWNQPNNVASVQRIQATAISGTIYVGDPPW